MKFQDRIPIEKRESIINALQTDPDLARRVAQMILLEDYFGYCSVMVGGRFFSFRPNPSKIHRGYGEVR